MASSLDEKHMAEHNEVSVPSTAEADDHVANEAIGTGNLPPGYFYSAKFLGTMIGVSLMNISLYVGYVLPVSWQS